jgi:hypothetical protein
VIGHLCRRPAKRAITTASTDSSNSIDCPPLPDAADCGVLVGRAPSDAQATGDRSARIEPATGSDAWYWRPKPYRSRHLRRRVVVVALCFVVGSNSCVLRTGSQRSASPRYVTPLTADSR